MTSRDVIKKIQDFTYLSWDEKTVTSGTVGTFLKSRERKSRGDIYYKLSCYERHKGVYGHESVNELIASRILERLGISHIPYKLIHARVKVNGSVFTTWLSESRDYRAANERRQALDTFIDLNSSGSESPLEFCEKRGWLSSIYRMMAFDYLIINRDRHGANIEVILKNGDVELAPLFDHGISLVFSCYDDELAISEFNPMTDKKVNNYLGSRSLEENLALIHRSQKPVLIGRILSDDRAWLFHGLERAIPSVLVEKIWEIVSMRWQYLIDMGIAKEI